MHVRTVEVRSVLNTRNISRVLPGRQLRARVGYQYNALSALGIPCQSCKHQARHLRDCCGTPTLSICDHRIPNISHTRRWFAVPGTPTRRRCASDQWGA